MILLLALLVGIEMLELHGPDGQTVFVNMHEISSLRMTTAQDLRQHFANGSKCIVVTTNGKFIAVTETCISIRDKILDNHNAKQK